jgi:hypothetical protein
VPAVLAYHVAAILVILPRTRPIRLALLPVNIWLFFRVLTSIDVVAGCGDPGYNFFGYVLGVSGRMIYCQANVNKRPGDVDS